MEDEGGRLVEREDNLHQVAMQYFKEFFEAKSVRNNSRLTSEIEPCITTHHNMRRFTMEEVVEALKDMAPLKATGTNGFPTFFLPKILAFD